MDGETFLICKDLRQTLTVKAAAEKYQKSESNIRAIARRYNINIKKPKQPERLTDRKRYNSRQDIAIPQLPFKAAKYGSLGRLTVPWSLREGMRKGKINDVESQIRYGLRTRFIS